MEGLHLVWMYYYEIGILKMDNIMKVCRKRYHSLRHGMRSMSALQSALLRHIYCLTDINGISGSLYNLKRKEKKSENIKFFSSSVITKATQSMHTQCPLM